MRPRRCSRRTARCWCGPARRALPARRNSSSRPDRRRRRTRPQSLLRADRGVRRAAGERPGRVRCRSATPQLRELQVGGQASRAGRWRARSPRGVHDGHGARDPAHLHARGRRVRRPSSRAEPGVAALRARRQGMGRFRPLRAGCRRRPRRRRSPGRRVPAGSGGPRHRPSASTPGRRCCRAPMPACDASFPFRVFRYGSDGQSVLGALPLVGSAGGPAARREPARRDRRARLDARARSSC